MSFLKLNYCQLIKIVLSQIGGNPLQQVYSQLSQGVPQITAKSGILPSGFGEVKALIEQVTTAINAAQQSVNIFDDTIERLGTQFYQNPIGTVLTGTRNVANSRGSYIDSQLAWYTPTAANTVIRGTLTQEKSDLGNLNSSLATYKTNTDRLSGVGTMSGSAAAGGCSLQDLLGSACAPNQDVPDIDLQSLVTSLKQGDAIAALQEKISSASGYSDYQQAMATFQSTVNGFNTNFNNLINKAAIRSAVTSQLTQIVYNLITGCGNQVFELTLNPTVKAAITPYAASVQKQQLTGEYYDSFGNAIAIEEGQDEITPIQANVTINI
jgi:hypothetical protein